MSIGTRTAAQVTEDTMEGQEEDLICQTLADVESRSVPMILLQAVQQNTRITERIHGAVKESKGQLDDVRADTKTIKTDVGEFKVQLTGLHARVTSLEAWRGTLSSILQWVFIALLTCVAGWGSIVLGTHYFVARPGH